MCPDIFSNRTSLLLSWKAGRGGCYYFKVHHNIFPCDASELGLNESTMGCLSTKISLLFGCFIQRESHVFVGWPGQLCCVNWCQATSAIYQLARRLKPWTRPLVSQTTRWKIRFQASSLTNISGWRGDTATVTRQETGQPTSVWYVSRSPLNWRACMNMGAEKTLEQVSFLGGRRISTKMIIFWWRLRFAPFFLRGRSRGFSSNGTLHHRASFVSHQRRGSPLRLLLLLL